MSAREKPAPLVWASAANEHWAADANPLGAALGDYMVLVWRVGGQFSYRSALRKRGTPVNVGRIVSHSGEDSAKASAEKRLRKVGA